MSNYPQQRTDRPPGLDVSGLSIEQAKADSRDCLFCDGNGWATIFHMRYTGEAYVVIQEDRGERREARRAQAYCACAAGRKMMVFHQQDGKDVFHKVPDIYSVMKGKSEWVLEDPSMKDAAKYEGLTPRQIIEQFAAAAKTETCFQAAQRERKRQREGLLVQFLVNALEAGPQSIGRLHERTQDMGCFTRTELRAAGDLARVHVDLSGPVEVWSLEKNA